MLIIKKKVKMKWNPLKLGDTHQNKWNIEDTQFTAFLAE